MKHYYDLDSYSIDKQNGVYRATIYISDYFGTIFSTSIYFVSVQSSFDILLGELINLNLSHQQSIELLTALRYETTLRRM